MSLVCREKDVDQRSDVVHHLRKRLNAKLQRPHVRGRRYEPQHPLPTAAQHFHRHTQQRPLKALHTTSTTAPSRVQRGWCRRTHVCAAVQNVDDALCQATQHEAPPRARFRPPPPRAKAGGEARPHAGRGVALCTDFDPRLEQAWQEVVRDLEGEAAGGWRTHDDVADVQQTAKGQGHNRIIAAPRSQLIKGIKHPEVQRLLVFGDQHGVRWRWTWRWRWHGQGRVDSFTSWGEGRQKGIDTHMHTLTHMHTHSMALCFARCSPSALGGIWSCGIMLKEVHDTSDNSRQKLLRLTVQNGG